MMESAMYPEEKKGHSKTQKEQKKGPSVVSFRRFISCSVVEKARQIEIILAEFVSQRHSHPNSNKKESALFHRSLSQFKLIHH